MCSKITGITTGKRCSLDWNEMRVSMHLSIYVCVLSELITSAKFNLVYINEMSESLVETNLPTRHQQ